MNKLVLNHAYVHQAVCLPSRTVVMIGVGPDTSKVWNLAGFAAIAGLNSYPRSQRAISRAQ